MKYFLKAKSKLGKSNLKLGVVAVLFLLMIFTLVGCKSGDSATDGATAGGEKLFVLQDNGYGFTYGYNNNEGKSDRVVVLNTQAQVVGPVDAFNKYVIYDGFTGNAKYITMMKSAEEDQLAADVSVTDEDLAGANYTYSVYDATGKQLLPYSSKAPIVALGDLLVLLGDSNSLEDALASAKADEADKDGIANNSKADEANGVEAYPENAQAMEVIRPTDQKVFYGEGVTNAFVVQDKLILHIDNGKTVIALNGKGEELFRLDEVESIFSYDQEHSASFFVVKADKNYIVDAKGNYLNEVGYDEIQNQFGNYAIVGVGEENKAIDMTTGKEVFSSSSFINGINDKVAVIDKKVRRQDSEFTADELAEINQQLAALKGTVSPEEYAKTEDELKSVSKAVLVDLSGKELSAVYDGIRADEHGTWKEAQYFMCSSFVVDETGKRTTQFEVIDDAGKVISTLEPDCSWASVWDNKFVISTGDAEGNLTYVKTINGETVVAQGKYNDILVGCDGAGKALPLFICSYLTPDGKYLIDVVDEAGTVLVDEVNLIYSMTQQQIAGVKGAERGLMDMTGNWLYQEPATK